jgi:hypothetical protein
VLLTSLETTMQKLKLDALAVDSFSTTAGFAAARGTVNGHQRAQSLAGCPVSWNGTCFITCAGCTEARCP